MRELKGLEIAARNRLGFKDGVWFVPSQSGNGKYRVTLAPDSCEGEGFQFHQQSCKHVHAARLVQERDHGGKAPAIASGKGERKRGHSPFWAQETGMPLWLSARGRQ
jgi:hypothetical protein